MRSQMYLSFLFILMLFVSGRSVADEAADARVASDKIMDLMSTGRYTSIWQRHMSEYFKEMMTFDDFKARVSQGRDFLGEIKSKKVIGMAYSDSDPNSGYNGAVYAFTYLNQYTKVNIYESVVVIDQDGKGFKMAGFWVKPEGQVEQQPEVKN